MIVELLDRDDLHVTLKVGDETTMMEAKSFDDYFVEIESGKYEALPEFTNMINLKLEDIEQIIPFLMKANATGSDFDNRKVGELVKKYASKWRISEENAALEITTIFSKFVAALTEKELVSRAEAKEKD